MKIAILFFLILAGEISFAQNIGMGTTAPDVSAMLHVSASNKGLLIPNVSLQSLTDATTIPNPAASLLLYNTNTGLGAGYYYNAGTPAAANWVRLITSATAQNGWGLQGNAGTSANSFIGTTDGAPIRFRINNRNAGIIDSANANTAIGYHALDSSTPGLGNVAVGYQALISNSEGIKNTAIGLDALHSNTSGNSNIAAGESALYYNTVGNVNLGIGINALYRNTDGSGNIAVGSTALLLNVAGSSNIAVGFAALYNNRSASYNTALGNTTLFNNTTGNYNTAIGENVMRTNQDGSQNTAIGWQADVSSPSMINATAIGANAIVNNSNTIQLGDPNVTRVNSSGDITVRNYYGLIRSIDGTQQKKLAVTVTVNVTIGAGSTVNIPFTFPESFGGIPDVYVGNATGGGGWAEKVMTVAGVTVAGGSLFVHNPSTSSDTPNFSIRIIAIGAQ